MAAVSSTAAGAAAGAASTFGTATVAMAGATRSY